jgi:hypothetical protein
VQPILPSIAITNGNRRPIALELYRTEVLALKNRTPFPVFPYLVASRTYNVRGILIALVEMVAEMKLLEQVCMIFLDGFPTVNRVPIEAASVDFDAHSGLLYPVNQCDALQ